MLNKISEKQKRQFYLYSLLYLPIGVMLGLLALIFIIKIIDIELDIGAYLFAILVVILASIYSVISFYKKISKNSDK